MRAIAELKPAGYNPRRLTEKQFEDLKKSFQKLGTLEPAVINMHPGRENIIIAGHQRIKVAAALGMTEYPCHEVQFTEKKEREANIRLNRNRGEWDFELLGNEFEINDLVGWGFEPLELGISAKEDAVAVPADQQLRSLFKLEIDCAGEEDQQKLFDELTKRGYECRVLTL